MGNLNFKTIKKTLKISLFFSLLALQDYLKFLIRISDKTEMKNANHLPRL